MSTHKSIFREKSLKKVSSPEELDQYIKATNPRLWFLLSAIIILLVGTIIWGVVGKLETKAESGCYIENDIGHCLISETNYEKINHNSFVRYKNKEYKLNDLPLEPIEVSSLTCNSYVLHTSNLSNTDWCYIVTFKADNIDEGSYKVVVVFDSISPLKFVFN